MRIFKLLLIIFLNGVINIIQAQTPEVDWASSYGGIEPEGAQAITADAQGNVIIAGYFQSKTLSFGDYTLTKNNSAPQIFVVKHNQQGEVLWAKQANGSFLNETSAVTTDLEGNIYVAGYFGPFEISFDQITLLNSNGNDREAFLVKYDPNGNVIWAKAGDGIIEQYGRMGLAVDPDGNIILNGTFESPELVFDSVIITSLINSAENIFIVKFDSDGNSLWGKSSKGHLKDWGNDLDVDGEGNIVTTGYFNSETINFDGVVLTNSHFNNTADIYIVKYNPNGDIIWAKNGGGSMNDWGQGISVDIEDNIYILGQSRSSELFFDGVVVPNPGNYFNIILTKYDSGGNFLWGKTFGGSGFDEAESIDTDNLGNVLISGTTSSAFIAFDQVVLNSANQLPTPIYLKFDPQGNTIWGGGGNPESHGFANGICVDSYNNIAITGYFVSESITFANQTLNLVENSDIFLLKLGKGVLDVAEREQDFAQIIAVPNPSSGEFKIQTKDVNIKHFEIYNNLGQKVNFKMLKSQKSISIEMKNVSNGLYFLNITTNNSIITKKIIIEN